MVFCARKSSAEGARVVRLSAEPVVFCCRFWLVVRVRFLLVVCGLDRV